MNMQSRFRSRPTWLAAVAALVVVLVAPVVVTTTATAATTLTVAQALDAQDGRSGTVTGHVIGQPTGSSTVIRSGFTADTAIAIADTSAETSTSRMLYVQVTTAYRSTSGLSRSARTANARPVPPAKRSSTSRRYRASRPVFFTSIVHSMGSPAVARTGARLMISMPRTFHHGASAETATTPAMAAETT